MNAKKRDAFIQRRFYTQNLLHINTFTHRRFHTETFFIHTHTDAFPHRDFYTKTDTFTHKHFHTQTRLFSRSHRHFYTQKLLHTDGFTHRRFYTHMLLHADAFYTRIHAFTRKRVYTQTH